MGDLQHAAEEEIERFCSTREGELELVRAAQKIYEEAHFTWQLDSQSAGKGVKKVSKAEAKRKARSKAKAELQARNIQKV